MQFPSLLQDVAEGDRLERRWSRLRVWLRSSAADFVLDEAVMGSLPAYAAEELLGDYEIPATPHTLRRLGVEINAALSA